MRNFFLSLLWTLGTLLGTLLALAGPHPARAMEDPLPEFAPYYVSLREGHVTARMGPGSQYPPAFIYERPGLPLKVVKEFEQWRQVVDFEKQSAWVHKSVLSKNRNALILPSDAPVRRESLADKNAHTYLFVPIYKGEQSAKPAFFLEQYFVVKLLECGQARCKISAKGYKGWVERTKMWGIFDNERF